MQCNRLEIQSTIQVDGCNDVSFACLNTRNKKVKQHSRDNSLQGGHNATHTCTGTRSRSGGCGSNHSPSSGWALLSITRRTRFVNIIPLFGRRSEVASPTWKRQGSRGSECLSLQCILGMASQRFHCSHIWRRNLIDGKKKFPRVRNGCASGLSVIQPYPSCLFYNRNLISSAITVMEKNK